MISNVLVHSLYLAMSSDVSVNMTGGGIFRFAHLPIIPTVRGLSYLPICCIFPFVQINVDIILTLQRIMATLQR
jgi:hypothetical protein